MSNAPEIIEYQCPCCNAGLHFSGAEQKLTCEYCDNSFDLDTIMQYNEALHPTKGDEFEWSESEPAQWDNQDQNNMTLFVCSSCGGELMTDGNTAATFCPFCDNPAVLPSRLSGGLRPEAVIPFKTTKEDAQKALLKLCQGKRLLPKDFTSRQRLEKITGMYVPFWLYDCSANVQGTYRGTRVSHWSDSRYNYTKTDYFMATRHASADFCAIPLDASTKMDDVTMESIEPFDQKDAVDFKTAYLSGFLADKYDVQPESGEDRVKIRAGNTLDELIAPTLSGYSSVVPTTKQLQVNHNRARYTLLPVWMLNTRYKDKIYTFAMNGQTGKMTGNLPIDKGKMWSWFAGVSAAVAGVAAAIGLLFF